MEYSVKDVIEKINVDWFLPAIQRPYVWGSRYEEEKYICRLFDSILQKYPIGLIILWKPDTRMAFRRFVSDFEEDNLFKPKDEKDFRLGSSLVYDGQQRLQTLYSCLQYSFKGRVLVFDLNYKRNAEEEGQDTGFRFIDENDSGGLFDVRMTTVFNLQNDSDKRQLRNDFKKKTEDEEVRDRIEGNLDNLFDVFASRKSSSISVFEIKGVTDNEVNEIFQRLNMGGVQLSNADLLFSRIKEVAPLFESDIIAFTKELEKGGYATISAYDVLQIINIIVKSRTKIDPEFAKGANGKRERGEFVQCWNNLKTPLQDTMVRYLSNHLNINRLQIVPRKMPLLALIVYMYFLYDDGGQYVIQERIPEWLKRVDKFFISAELNDWSLQSYTDNFTRIFRESKNKKEFPLEELFEWVRQKGNRFIDISEKTFCDNKWFSLKVVMPAVRYSFKDDMTKRFNPELDHIFPVHLKDSDSDYRKAVDIVWNMQPVTGDINIDKSNFNPLEYFEGSIPGHEYGKEYFKYYKEVPQLDNPVWKDYKLFINWRRDRFIKRMKTQYDICIKDNDVQLEDAEAIKSKAEAIINKHRQDPSGDLAYFIRQCESSEKLDEDGLIHGNNQMEK